MDDNWVFAILIIGLVIYHGWAKYVEHRWPKKDD